MSSGDEQRRLRGEPPDARITLDFQRRTLRVFFVSEQELDELRAPWASIHLTLLGLAVGAVLSLTTALVSADLSDRAFATFVALDVLGVVLALYFGQRAVADWRRAERRIERIKQDERLG